MNPEKKSLRESRAWVELQMLSRLVVAVSCFANVDVLNGLPDMVYSSDTTPRIFQRFVCAGGGYRQI